MKSILIPLAASMAIAVAASGATAAPEVVVSIKPVHSLVAAIMQGVGEPQLIVDGAASPHTYNLRPSNARKLETADVVFWVGPGLEAFLEKPLEALAAKATVVELEDAKGLEKLPLREGGPLKRMIMAKKAMRRMMVMPKSRTRTSMVTSMTEAVTPVTTVRATMTMSMAPMTHISGLTPPMPRPWPRQSKPR